MLFIEGYATNEAEAAKDREPKIESQKKKLFPRK